MVRQEPLLKTLLAALLPLLAAGALTAGALTDARAAQTMEVVAQQRATLPTRILALDEDHRLIVVESQEGATSRVIQVPETVLPFDRLAVGDTVTVNYLEAVLLEARPTDAMSEEVRRVEAAPDMAYSSNTADIAFQVVTMDTRLMVYDSTHHLALLEGPDGWQREVAIKDPALQAALADFDAEQSVHVTFTEAVATKVTKG